jgi:NAD(P)-dependent dehydrogenase (short-subunit alcohol dehydrogenase family)
VSNERAAAGRVAVVSGAGTGIGQAIAAKFGGLGWNVAIGGRRVELLSETAELVAQAGGRSFAHHLDVTDGDSVDQFFALAEDELGPVGVVINNAATARYGPLDDFSPAEIALEIATKLTGALLMARRGIQSMRKSGSGGDILFVASLAAVNPWPFHLPYASANAGVEHAARTLRLELEGTGIRVTMLRCGETAGTDFSSREQGSERFDSAQRYWFGHGLLRHTGLMMPDMVADAVLTAVTLPEPYQLGMLEVTPTAPVEEPPGSYDEFIQAMIRRYMPT